LAPVFYIDSTLYDSPYLFWKILGGKQGGKQGQNFQKNEWLLHLQIFTFFNLVLIIIGIQSDLTFASHPLSTTEYFIMSL
jgi:hypothetical protein